MIDVLVAGAGPVGLVTAIHAALSGLDVVVVEPRSGPIDKACGEGLMPDALARLAKIDVDPPGVAFRGIKYLAGEHVAEARFTGAPGRGVRRTELHVALRERALARGVRFVTDRVDTIVQGDSWVEAAGLRSRYLVGADGLHSQVRRTLGLGAPGEARPRFGVRQHFAIRPWTDMVEVHWLSDAELYVTPVAETLVGVAVLGTAPLHLEAAIGRVPELAGRLADAAVASASRGAGPLRQRVKARHSGRALLVGDAAGYVDALTGEGLRVGFAEAEAVVRAIVAGVPGGYESEWRRITRSYRWHTNALLWTSSRPSLRPKVVPAARALPWAFRHLVEGLAY
jgi:flavin-dependent dehydrogenase